MTTRGERERFRLRRIRFTAVAGALDVSQPTLGVMIAFPQIAMFLPGTMLGS